MLPDAIRNAEKYVLFASMKDADQRNAYFELCVDHTMRVEFVDREKNVHYRRKPISRNEAARITATSIRRFDPTFKY